MAEDNDFDYKKALYDFLREHGNALLESAQQESLSQFKAVLDYSRIAINGAFLLNGMAGIAILYNIKLMGDKGYIPILCCALGAFFAVLCAGMSYLTQRFYAGVSLKNNELKIEFFFGIMSDFIGKIKTDRKPPELIRPVWGDRISVVACIVWSISVVLFLFAAYFALSTLLNSTDLPFFKQYHAALDANVYESYIAFQGQ